MQSGSCVLSSSGLNHTDLRCLIPSDQRPLLARMPTKGGLFLFSLSFFPSFLILLFALKMSTSHPSVSCSLGCHARTCPPNTPQPFVFIRIACLANGHSLAARLSAFQGVSILSKDAQPVLGWLWLLMKSSVSLPWDRMQELKVHKIQCPLLGSQEGRDPRGQQLGRWCISLESSLVVSNLIFLSLQQLLILQLIPKKCDDGGNYRHWDWSVVETVWPCYRSLSVKRAGFLEVLQWEPSWMDSIWQLAYPSPGYLSKIMKIPTWNMTSCTNPRWPQVSATQASTFF